MYNNQNSFDLSIHNLDLHISHTSHAFVFYFELSQGVGGVLPAGPCQTQPFGKQFAGPNWAGVVITHPAPAAAADEVGAGGVVTGGAAGGTELDGGCGTTRAEEEGGGVCWGLFALAALLEATEGCAVGPAPVPFPAPAPAGAVPSDGVGAHVAESPVAKLISPSACKASGCPAGRVPT